MIEVGIIPAFIAGLLAFISPCVLPIVPVYITMMTNKAIYHDKNVRVSERIYLVLNSIFFVLGFSLVFIVLGSTATLLGRFLREYITILGRIGGGILIIFGLHYMGLFRLPFLNVEKRFNIPRRLKTGYLSSFFIGVVFSFGWVPCVGLVLAAILLLAAQLETLLQGVVLLSFFSLGLGLPFILSSIFLGIFSKALKRINRHLGIISKIAGIFLIILGIIFVTDSMLRITGWLLRYIPVLDRINI